MAQCARVSRRHFHRRLTGRRTWLRAINRAWGICGKASVRNRSLAIAALSWSRVDAGTEEFVLFSSSSCETGFSRNRSIPADRALSDIGWSASMGERNLSRPWIVCVVGQPAVPAELSRSGRHDGRTRNHRVGQGLEREICQSRRRNADAQGFAGVAKLEVARATSRMGAAPNRPSIRVQSSSAR